MVVHKHCETRQELRDETDRLDAILVPVLLKRAEYISEEEHRVFDRRTQPANA